MLTVIQGCKQNTFNNINSMNKIENQSSAINRAIVLTGLDCASKKKSARQIIITNDTTPFLAGQFEGRDSWCVEFNDVSLTDKLKSAQLGFPDAYQFKRKFLVLIDAKTGQLIKVQTDYQGKASDMKPEPSAISAEAQLKSGAEHYGGLPTTDPKISFLDAVSVALTNGSNPLMAKEINGLYVMDSHMGSVPRPVWIITTRGIPPMPLPKPSRVSGKIEATTLRCVIDAMTGKCLFATGYPQPD